MSRLRLGLLTLLPVLLLGFALTAGGTPLRPASRGPQPPAIAATGVLTEYGLPPNRGPWELQWDAARNWIWFAEGQHSSPAIDQIGAIDAGTNVLREWGVPTGNAAIHATALARNGDLWFTEAFGAKIGRLQPISNTITEWALPGASEPHDLVVDDLDAQHVTVWFSERDNGWVSSFDLSTGQLRRHVHPVTGAAPHGLALDVDHSLWVVDTCDQAVGHFVPGVADQWTLWQPPTTINCGPPHSGPLFGVLRNGSLWYSEPEYATLLRLQPAGNTFTIWQAPGAGNGFESASLTQIDLDPAGNLFYTAMRGDKIGRLEPGGATTPTVVAVVPTVVALPTPAAVALTSTLAVYTPIVTQLAPAARVLTGTRTGGIVEWPLSTGTPIPGFLGPGRGIYGGGGFWVSEINPDLVARFAPDTVTPAPTDTPTVAAPSPTRPAASPTSPPAGTPTGAAPSPTRPAASATPRASTTPGASTTPCTLSFSDVHPADYFYTPVLYLACHGVISGYGDGTFRPYSQTTRAQMVKIVILGFSKTITTPPAGGHTFADVPPAFPFFAVIETAAGDTIVSGYACGGPGEPCDAQARPYFRPYANVTRSQLAKIVVVAAGWTLQNPPGASFADVPPSSPFYRFVETAACHAVISGYQCGGPGEPCDAGHRPYFRPYNNSTRGQIAKIVYGALTGSASCAAVP